MACIELKHGQEFLNRAAIHNLLGGNWQSGITMATKAKAILLFKNEEELYEDFFYPKGFYDYCLYTGIGRTGHQDSIQNYSYDLNVAVMSHKQQNKPLLLFEKRKGNYCFIGEYQLTETHQNVQPDDNNNLRRVFVFHLKKISDSIEIVLTEA
ncbi:MAG: hypothetical protein HFE77_03480 [Clostridiales bacterium]|nr:hypothetical protein [Clostridiales bacterium]